VRRLLIVPLVSAVVLCSIKASAAVDPKIHKLCAKATDYVGCVKMNSSPTPVQPENSASDLARNKLRDELRKLGARIENSSLLTLSTNVRDFRDALSLTKPEEVGVELYKNAKIIDVAIDRLRTYWSDTISNSSLETKCEYMRGTVSIFNILFSGDTSLSTYCVRSCALFGCSDNYGGRNIRGELADVISKAAVNVADSDRFNFPPLPIDKKLDCGKQATKALFDACMAGK